MTPAEMNKRLEPMLAQYEQQKADLGNGTSQAAQDRLDSLMRQMIALVDEAYGITRDGTSPTRDEPSG